MLTINLIVGALAYKSLSDTKSKLSLFKGTKFELYLTNY